MNDEKTISFPDGGMIASDQGRGLEFGVDACIGSEKTLAGRLGPETMDLPTYWAGYQAGVLAVTEEILERARHSGLGGRSIFSFPWLLYAIRELQRVYREKILSLTRGEG